MYKCHKINLNRVGSYTHFPQWIKHKKTENNDDDYCFWYDVTVALKHEKIVKICIG